MSDWLKKYWKWIALALVLVALSAAASFLPVKEWMKSFTDFVRGHGVLGVLLFIGAYALATVCFLPGLIFTIAAGLVYGALGGTAVASMGATIGAALAFLVGRYLFRQRIEKFAARNKRFKAVDQAIGKRGWKIIALLRLSPLIPFNLSNYFYGVTAIPFWPYLLASWAGMLPGTFLYAYLGAIGQAGLEGGKSSHSSWQWVSLGVGLIATVVVSIVIGRISKNALAKAGAAKK